MAKYKIIPSSRTIVQLPISIGHKAEKGVEAIEFDLTAWVGTYGSGTATIIMRRWGDEVPYPVALEIDENNKAVWTLSDTDTAKAGMAYAQLSYIVGDEVVKKSDIYTFRVMDSLTGEGDPPEAYESWLEHLTHLAAEAMAEVLDIEGIVTDKTLTVDGGVADGKATGDALALKADKSTTYTKAEVDQMIEDVEVETDTTLAIAGAPADAAETGRQIDLLKADLDALEPGLSDTAKAALLACFDHVAWSGTGGQSYYDALESALYPNTGLVRIEAVFTQGSAVVYPATPLNDLKAYLVVTGYYSNGTSRVITDYTLSGTLATGTSTVTVAREGKTTTFNVTVSAPYWDYEWYSSSRTLPDGMTATEYDFTTENGVLFAKTPKLDFEYTGNCKMQIEIKAYSENSNGQYVFAINNNPQFQIQNAEVSSNQFRGIKMVLDSALGTSSEHGMVAAGINGTNALIAGSNSGEYHTYEITANNNVYELSIDGNPVTLIQNTDTTQYIAFTGIGCFQQAPPAFNGAFIKSIKFKRL